MDWDDLKFLLAVADAGGMIPAARNLDVTADDVAKRIIALETALNCELVTRTADGVAITAPGQRAVAVARAFAAQLATLVKEVGGEYGEIAGRVCVTSTAGFMPRAIKAFSPLREKYPALEIDAMVSSHVVDLRRKEADIAVRMFRDKQDGLGMEKLGVMGWSLYASDKYLAGRTKGANLLDGHQLIAYDSNFSNTAGGRWIAANAPAEAIAMHVGGIRQAMEAAAAGRGVCLVPCHLAGEFGLVRVTDQVLTTNEVYAVYLAERANEPRLRVVIDALLDLFARDHVALTGA